VFLNDFEGWRRFAVYAACGIVLFSQTKPRKECRSACGLDRTSVKTRPWHPRCRVAGILTSPSTVDFVDSTIRIVRSIHPNDTIFVYPELGFFYGAPNEARDILCIAQHRRCSRFVAKQEAERLLRARPPC